jgi:hypothetical protein
MIAAKLRLSIEEMHLGRECSVAYTRYEDARRRERELGGMNVGEGAWGFQPHASRSANQWALQAAEKLNRRRRFERARLGVPSGSRADKTNQIKVGF